MEVPPTSTNLQASRGDEVRCKPSRRKLGGVEVRRTDEDLFFEESESIFRKHKIAAKLN